MDWNEKSTEELACEIETRGGLDMDEFITDACADRLRELEEVIDDITHQLSEEEKKHKECQDRIDLLQLRISDLQPSMYDGPRHPLDMD